MVKLAEGDVIAVHGFVMLPKIESGQKYRIDRVGQHNGFDYCELPLS